MALDNILTYFDKVIKTRQDHYKVICPCHEEKTPSLGITLKPDGFVLMHCFGCGANGSDVMHALGLNPSDLFPDDNNFKPDYDRVVRKQLNFSYEQALDIIEHELNEVVSVLKKSNLDKESKGRAKVALKRIRHVHKILKQKS